jgi:tRNA (cytidine32/uridine32-2'-O)-methyltransferase
LLDQAYRRLNESSPMLANVRIVLVHTTHPGNIGAVARAMKNMGLSELALVSPRFFPHADATARASGADELLARARVCATLDEALADCRLVVGTSARDRHVEWINCEPRECAALLVGEAARGPVALVFGRESSGLTNEELDRCDRLVQIPANPEYSSLNVAMAVQVLAYELLLASRGAAAPPGGREPDHVPATAAQMESFFEHLGQALDDIGFTAGRHSEKLLRRLRRLFLRLRPDVDELTILRGILSAAQGRKSMRRE